MASLACLFYRYYAEPLNNNIYEVLKCESWSKHAVVSVHARHANR